MDGFSACRNSAQAQIYRYQIRKNYCRSWHLCKASNFCAPGVCANASRLAISYKEVPAIEPTANCRIKSRRDSKTARGVISEESGRSMPSGRILISMVDSVVEMPGKTIIVQTLALSLSFS